MRRVIKKIFNKKGYYNIIEAKTGEEGVLRFMLLQPALVTMDITLPYMNGIEATRRIIKKNPLANVVICSSIGQKIMVEEALEAGAKDFIVKPFREKELELIIQRFL